MHGSPARAAQPGGTGAAPPTPQPSERAGVHVPGSSAGSEEPAAPASAAQLLSTLPEATAESPAAVAAAAHLVAQAEAAQHAQRAQRGGQVHSSPYEEAADEQEQALLSPSANHSQDEEMGVPLEPDYTKLGSVRRRGGGARRLGSWLRDDRLRTSALVNAAGVMERMDEQIMPALYAYVAASFGATPTQLGVLTLSRALVQALASPLGGVLGHYYNRIWVISAGCVIWGCCTAAFSTAQSIAQGAAFWAFNGVGLSLVIPSSQSLTADYFSAEARGRAFGALYLTGALGGMLGSMYATNMGSRQPLGLEGWRFVFLSVAAVSLAIGAANLVWGSDPRMAASAASGKARGAAAAPPAALRSALVQMRSVLGIPSFMIIVVQGIVGSIPWNAMVFFTLYLQLIGMSDFAASLCVSLFLGATALGGLLGGFIGDRAAVRYPNHGRIFVCQFSVVIGVPFSLLILKGLPHDGSDGTVAVYCTAFILMGVLKTWAAPACNNPIFAEIVPASMRNLIYAFDRCFEGAIAACAAPLVGRLAERMFGFKGAAARSGDAAEDLAKARALGSALLLFMILPWGLCTLLYTGLHFTYPADKRRAAAAAAKAASDAASNVASADGSAAADNPVGSGSDVQLSGSGSGAASPLHRASGEAMRPGTAQATAAHLHPHAHRVEDEWDGVPAERQRLVGGGGAPGKGC